MSLLVFGVNHRTAPVAIRERVSLAPQQLPGALREFSRTLDIKEVVILSTCNRTEFYCHQDDTDTVRPLRWLIERHGLVEGELLPYLFWHPQAEAVRHLLRVACGLDSMALGEPQILGQLKSAYQTALHSGTLGKLLNKLFQHAFSVAKQVRSDTAIGSSPVSVAFAAVRLAEQIFGDLSSQTALLIGAGETIELAAQHLRKHGLKRMIIANRTLERSQLIAQHFGGYAIALQRLPEHLAEADILISATASPTPILERSTAERALKLRKHRPMFMVDLAVPRDIEPGIADLPDVYLYTVDDLEAVIQENLQSRRVAASQADDIIAAEVGYFMDWLQSLDALSTVRAIRDRADDLRRQAVERARRRLAQGDDPREVLERLARVLTNKLVHTPSVRLREASAAGRPELVKAACELFDLDWPPGDALGRPIPTEGPAKDPSVA